MGYTGFEQISQKSGLQVCCAYGMLGTLGKLPEIEVPGGPVLHRSQLFSCLLLCNNGLLLGTAALRLLWGLCGGLGHNWVCTSCGASVGPLDVVVFDWNMHVCTVVW